jgi:hypothetical protein
MNDDAKTQEPEMRVSPLGSKMWYLYGKRHREDGPAVELAHGDKHWYMDGLRHREDGPAVEYHDGGKLWYLHGKNYNGNVVAWAKDVLKLHNKPHDDAAAENYLRTILTKDDLI